MSDIISSKSPLFAAENAAEFREASEHHLCSNVAPALQIVGLVIILFEAVKFFATTSDPAITVIVSLTYGVFLAVFPNWCAGMPGHNWGRLRLVYFGLVFVAGASYRLGGGDGGIVGTPASMTVLCIGAIARDRSDGLRMALTAMLISFVGAAPWEIGSAAVGMSLAYLTIAAGGAYAISALIEQLRAVDFTKAHSLWAESRMDPLTGLGNRRYFEEATSQQTEVARILGLTFSVLMIDIDFFKRVNDKYGHDSGDLVIREVAARLRSNARGGDLIARWGGEEFVAFFPNTRVNLAFSGAERFRKAICSRPIVIATGEAIPISISIGIADLAPKAHGEIRAAMDRADVALYQAKLLGRNRCERWSPGLPDTKK